MASATTDTSGGLQIELLGPVVARADGRPVALGGQRPRALLALLALVDGRVVTTDRLIDELWGDDPPARARESLQMHVSRLRKALVAAGIAPGRLVNEAGGYRLRLEPGERDVDRWEAGLRTARRAREAGELEAARLGIEDALGAWSGEALGGVGENGALAAARARLQEARLGAVIDGIELDLELGRHDEVLGALEELVVAHPFHERLVELQMLALYRAGRQADALAAFQAARSRFVDELGIEPEARLRGIHEEVLRHADGLAAPQGAVPAWRRGHGLPRPPNRTIGREDELAAIVERLRAAPGRLLTLSGPGGVGKTRLALEAARRAQADAPDGAHFVPLAALRGAQDVPAAIIKALGMIVLDGESAAQAVERSLGAKHLLLVLDNLEHLPAAAPFVGGLLEACPALTVLATSRQPLALQAEERYPVAALADADAVALFAERAQAVDPGFGPDDDPAAVAEICRRVDGLPLAIELAAARSGLLSADEIAERLDEALGVLGADAGDVPARHQTLRATIDWSHDLLDDAERLCFARFAVFAGGATVQAAEMITGAGLDTLDRLVAKSLFERRRHAQEPTRLQMLETIRNYAEERLAATADQGAVRERHYRYYLELAQRHGTDRALWGAGGNGHLAHLDADIHNLHAALGWAVGQTSAEPALGICAALGHYWLMRDHFADAVWWIDQAVSMPGTDACPALRVRVLCVKARALWPLGRAADTPAVMAEAEALARALGDPAILSLALEVRAGRETVAGRLDVGDTLADEAFAVASAAGDDWAIAKAVYQKAIAAPTIADLRERVERAASLLEAVGNVCLLAELLASSAYGALCMGGDDDARELVARAIPLAREIDRPGLWMMVRGNFGLAALMTGDTSAARHAFREELRLCRELVVRPFASEGLFGLAAVAAAGGDARRAARLAGAAAAHRHGWPEDPMDARLEAAFFESARATCGADAWETSARDGAALDFEDAIADALEESRGRSCTARS